MIIMNKNIKKANLNLVIQIFLFLILVVIDQVTKKLAIAYLLGHEDVKIIGDSVVLHYLQNYGAAFGILQNKPWAFFVLTTVVFIILVMLIIFIHLSLKKYCRTCTDKYRSTTFSNMIFINYIFTVLAAGAVGNLIDRIAYGYVVDFIYFKFIDFPIFNIADICVTSSAFTLVIFFIFFYKEDKNFQLFLKKNK